MTGCKQVRFRRSRNSNSELTMKDIMIRTIMIRTPPVEIQAREALKSCRRPADRKSIAGIAGRPKTTCLRVTLNEMNSHAR